MIMEKKFHQIILAALVLVVGFVVGRTTLAGGNGGLDSKEEMAGAKGRTAGELRIQSAKSRARGGDPAHSGMDSKFLDELLYFIYSEPENTRAYSEWGDFVEGLNAQQISEVMDRLYAKGYSDHMRQYYMMLWKKWGQIDPHAALAKAMGSDGLSFASDAGYSRWATILILNGWSKQDPHAAVRWMDMNPQASSSSRTTINILMYHLAEDGDTDQAVSLMMNMSDANLLNSAMQDFVEDYGSEHEFKDLLSWAQSIEDEKLKELALASIAENSEDFNHSKQFADYLLVNSTEGRSRLMNSVMMNMSQRDFESAVQYFETIEDEALKSSAFAGFFNAETVGHDPPALLSLMDAHPSLRSDELVEQFVDAAYSNDRSLAMSAIDRIEDDQRRHDSYHKHFLAWLADDSESAMDWSRAHGMPESIEIMLRDLLVLQGLESVPGN